MRSQNIYLLRVNDLMYFSTFTFFRFILDFRQHLHLLIDIYHAHFYMTILITYYIEMYYYFIFRDIFIIILLYYYVK